MIKLVKTADLKAHPDNPNSGDVPAVMLALATDGWHGTIVVQAPTGRRKAARILAGHTRTEALNTLATDGIVADLDETGERAWTYEEIAARVELPPKGKVSADVLDVTDAVARRKLIGDNQLPRLASTDERRLAKVLSELAAEDGLTGSGYEADDVDALLSSLRDEEPPPAKREVRFEAKVGKDGTSDDPLDQQVPEVAPKDSVTLPGDVWLLGDHRLMCGDSFEVDDRNRLLDGFAVSMILTDPPFAIYGSASGISSSVADDKMVRPFFEQLGKACANIVPDFTHIYVHCDWRSYATLWDGFKRAKLTPKNCLVWDKGGAGLGNNYANTHEFVAFFVKMPPQKTMTSGMQTGQRPVHRPNVLHFPRVTGAEREHNAAKPVAMLAQIIENGCDKGEGVLDLFGGSGSTLMAAQATDRRCAMMEMEPGWCDVICERFERSTGVSPVLERTGKHVPFVKP